MTPLQSPAKPHAQLQECIIQSQRTIEWSRNTMAISNETMRRTRIRLGRGAGRNKQFLLPSEARVRACLRFFRLEL
ncbi:MAG TPA: hypothetical protein VIB39_04675 [Candidatus Angelobacter sp.]|jgi:hypothetical protein